MLGKKVLSVLSLLFVVKFKTALAGSAIDIDDCGGMTTCEAEVETKESGYCISGNTIIDFDTENNCIPTDSDTKYMAGGINVFNFNEASGVLGEGIEDGNILIMIDCEDTDRDNEVDTCKQTFGYYSVGEKVYKIGNVETGMLTPQSGNSATDCVGKIGSIINYNSGNYLCLTDNKSVELKATAGSSNYLMKKEAGNIFVEDDDTTKVSIVIKASNNALTFNNFYSDEEYCVNDSNKVMGRIENFCEGTALDNLYSCTDGLCELMETPLTEAGQYIQDGKLYDCTEGSGKTTCTKDSKGDHDGIIVAQKLETNDKLSYEKSIGKTVLEGVTDISKVEILLYHCAKGACTRTEGFVKHGGSLATTSYCASGNKCAAAADLTIAGTVVIDNPNLKVYDIDNTSDRKDENVLFIIPTKGPKTYFYKKDGSHFVMIDTVDDGATQHNLLAVGIVPNANIPGKVNVNGNEVIETCTVTGLKTYTVTNSGTSVDDGVDCEVLCNIDSPATCKKGYYLKQTPGGALSNAGGQEGTIYYCDGKSDSPACDALFTSTEVGYYLNADTVTTGAPDYIKCTEKTGTCTSVTATAAENCDTLSIGSIIKSVNERDKTTTYNLCLEAGLTGKKANIATITAGTASEIKGQYFIDGSAVGGTASEFIIVDLDGQTVLKNESETITYRYTNADYKVRYRNDKDDICTAGPKDIYEFKIKDKNAFTYDNKGKKSYTAPRN